MIRAGSFYKLYRKNQQLAQERHPMYEKNRFMKFLGVFLFLYYAAILILFGVIATPLFKDLYPNVSAIHTFHGYLWWWLIFDFWLRVYLFETPHTALKPYRLLPVRRIHLSHIHLVRMGLHSSNLFWLFFLIPFGISSVWPMLGATSCIVWLIGLWLILTINNFACNFVRSLASNHLAWWLLPLGIQSLWVLCMLLPETNWLEMPTIRFLYQMTLGSPFPFVVILLILGCFYVANLRLHETVMYNEVAKKEEIAQTSQMSYLNRFGVMGEFLKLELKLRMRNKQVRTSFLVLIGMMLFFSLMLYFTDIYTGSFMKSFILLYEYVGLGATNIIGIMCLEGNYIDGLMSRKEKIHDLLRAKYYFNIGIILIPLILITPLTLAGKIPVLMNLSYFIFSIGFIYPLMFQMAVYNNNTLPLNQKVTGVQGSMIQQICSFIVLFLPIAFEKALVALMGPVWGYVPMILLGMVGLVTHRIWIRNIYQRFMLRRHHLMDGFRSSRQF